MAAAQAAAINHAIKQSKKKEKEEEEEQAASGGPTTSAQPGGTAVRRASKAPVHTIPDILPGQTRVRSFYNHPNSQLVVAVLIVLNFMTNIIEKEIDAPDGKKYPRTWQALEDTFNWIFLIELLVNFYGNFFVPFWKVTQLHPKEQDARRDGTHQRFVRPESGAKGCSPNGWNIFDMIVVTVGVISLLRIKLPPSLSMLRMLRAFRVFRLFKRIKSLNKIIVSLGKALPGVTNAFLIMFIIMCIYAILAVEFFSEVGTECCDAEGNITDCCEDGQESSSGDYCSTMTCALMDYEELGGDGPHEMSSLTPRGYRYGEEYYGTFTRALYTLWQVLTGESWSEMVARPLLFGYGGLFTGLYFVSFIIITQIVLVNVVVAVLLEKMVDNSDDEEEEEEEGGALADGAKCEEARSEASKGAKSEASKPDGQKRKASTVGEPANATILKLEREQQEMKQRLDEIHGMLSRLVKSQFADGGEEYMRRASTPSPPPKPMPPPGTGSYGGQAPGEIAQSV